MTDPYRVSTVTRGLRFTRRNSLWIAILFLIIWTAGSFEIGRLRPVL